MKYVIYMLLFVIVFGCTSNTSSKSASDADTSATVNNPPETESPRIGETITLDGCYIRVTGRDTLLLQIKETSGTIKGTMKFDNYEKDSSSGTVTGKMENGKLVLWYAFASEGMQSYAQHIMQPVKDGLILGNSDIKISSDSAFIKDLSTVAFPISNKLTRTECSGIFKPL